MKRPHDRKHPFPASVILQAHEWPRDDRKRPSGCQERVRGLLRRFDGHRIKDVRRRLGDELADAFYERQIGQVTIENMRCAEREEQRLIVKGGGGDDGRETRQLGELNCCVKHRYIVNDKVS